MTYHPKLVLTWRLEYTVHMSLEQCIKQLESLEEGNSSWFSFGRWNVHLYSETPQRTAFEIERSVPKANIAWAIGYLEKINESSTRIVGKTGTPWYDIVWRGVLSIGLPLFFYVKDAPEYPVGFDFTLVMILVISLIMILQIAWTRVELSNMFWYLKN